ncbi:YdeI/OmpD-associated family protein [Flexivirga sp. B27]
MEFETTIQLHGKDNLGITVPDNLVEELGGGKRPKVVVTLGDYTYRTSIARMGGQFLFGVNKEHRAKAGVHAGDEVTVGLELDTAPRDVTLPPEVAAALTEKPALASYFASLSYTKQKEYVTWIESAKKPETRENRIAKTLANLAEGKPLR